jgi:hypothetical protein
MLRILPFTFAIACSFSVAGQSAKTDDLFARLCPENKKYALDSTESAVLQAVAGHFKRFEWSPEAARAEGTFADAELARHAVPALKAPQVIFLNAIRYQPAFDAALNVELERHGVPADLAATLKEGLRERNADAVTLDIARSRTGFVPLSCRDFYLTAFGGPSPPSADLRNASRAISVSLPAFDNTRTSALLLAVSSSEYASEGKLEDMELILLRKKQSGSWDIAWHTGVAGSMQRGSSVAEAAKPEDYAVFDAMLSYLRAGSGGAPCTAVVNQTRTGPLPSPRALAPKDINVPALEDLGRRSASSVFIGRFSSRHAVKLVQREAMNSFNPGQKPECSRGIQFTLPGYGSGTAVVVYSIQSVVSEGFESDEGWALLRKTGDAWRVDKHAYQRWALTAR